MDSLFLLIPIAMVFVAIAVKAFLWAVDNNQYDDLDTEGQRILFDDDEQAPPTEVNKTKQHNTETDNKDT